MNRIESNVGAQVGDVVRPVQADNDRKQQAAQAARDETSTPEQAAAGPVSADDLKGVVAAMQQVVETATGKSLQFSLHEETDDVVVTVTDTETDEVIKQIPGEEVLRLREHIKDLVGLLVDKTA